LSHSAVLPLTPTCGPVSTCLCHCQCHARASGTANSAVCPTGARSYLRTTRASKIPRPAAWPDPCSTRFLQPHGGYWRQA